MNELTRESDGLPSMMLHPITNERCFLVLEEDFKTISHLQQQLADATKQLSEITQQVKIGSQYIGVTDTAKAIGHWQGQFEAEHAVVLMLEDQLKNATKLLAMAQDRVKELENVLAEHHEHDLQDCFVHFDNDCSNPEHVISTNLGEAYAESDLCEKTIAAIAKEGK